MSFITHATNTLRCFMVSVQSSNIFISHSIVQKYKKQNIICDERFTLILRSGERVKIQRDSLFVLEFAMSNSNYECHTLTSNPLTVERRLRIH